MTRAPRERLASRLVSFIAFGLVLAALTGGALAGAQSPRPEPGAHVLVVPGTAEGRSALERSSARVIARYETFTLVEAKGRDEERLRGAGADRRDDMLRVRTAAGAIDPARQRRSLAAKGAPEPGETLALVQFEGPPKDAWLERLRATGGRPVSYLAQNGYVVYARGAAVDRLADLVGTDPAVRAVAELSAADKVEGDPARVTTVAVQTVAGAAGQDARQDAATAGPTVRPPSAAAELRTQFVRLSETEIDALASDPAVVAVEPWAPPELLDERAAQIVAGNLPPAGPGYLAWHDAQGFPPSLGFTIDVTDEGLDQGAPSPVHPDLSDRIDYATDYSNDSFGATDCGGHGTNVASIAAGLNASSGATHEDAGGFNYGLGVAPRADVGASKIFRCDGSFGSGSVDFTTLTAAAAADGAVVSNNSWGAGLGDYNVDSQEYDRLVRDADPSIAGHQPMVEVFAAGNDGDDVTGAANEGYGSINWPGTAKNVITVGASENVRAIGAVDGCGVPDSGADSAADVIDLSSRGPTDDGRLKPDLVAPGTHVVGARPNHPSYHGLETCNPFFAGSSPFVYSLLSGTSQAAPEVSGAAALVRDWYRRVHGLGSDVPSPALTKALLLNTATDLAGGDDGKGAAVRGAPNMDQGWGRVNLTNTFDSTARAFYDQADVLDDPGDTFLRAYQVDDPDRPVKVTVAWTDAPGNVTGSAFVNDLDLTVDAGGRTYKGNVFAGGRSRPGGAADPRNNVESVFLPDQTDGRFAVEVRATTLGGDGVPGTADVTDQDFALVVSNATEQAAPVLTHEQTTIDDSTGGDGDSALEPGESFALDERVENVGTADATTVSGTLTSSQLAVTGPASTYPDILDGGAEQNDTPFEADLSGAATCGEDVGAMLELDTDQGTQTVPISLPTGSASATPSARTRNPGLAIPDDSSAGVTSTLSVTSGGRIKDLDVRIDDLDHSFVGDLSIELEGPDGTTVQLAHHPGGPDNGGNDLTGTVFDDDVAQSLSDGAAPYTGRFKPQDDQLSRFDGKSQQGVWRLRVRDLFEDDTGVLRRWGTDTRVAHCDSDVAPPDTAIDSGPQGTVASRSASFAFSASEPGSTFECSLDAGDFEPCDTPKAYAGLADGAHTFRAKAFDAIGNEDPVAAERSWTIDATSPAVSISAPAGGSTTTDTTPSIAGSAGTAAGDAGTVTVKLFAGTLAAGLPAQTMIVPRGAGGSWAAEPAALAEGTYSVRAEQVDSVGNTGVSATHTFTVSLPDLPPTAPPPLEVAPPSFALAPAEARTADALAGRLAVLAACATACRTRARLTGSTSVARRLGLTRRAVRGARHRSGSAETGAARAVTLGRGSARLRRGGTARARLRVDRGARVALRARARTTLTLRVTVTDGARTLELRRAVLLHRSAGLRRIAKRGLKLWAVCSASCPLRGNLSLSARTARRLGIKAKRGARVEVANGRAALTSRGASLTLRLARSSRKALLRARRVRTRMEAVAGKAPDPVRRAARALSLRR